MAEITLPRFDENYEESSIIFWHKQEGDQVEKGDVLVEVQTEKAVSEIEAETAGILQEIRVKRGEVAKVGDVLCVISDGEQAFTSKEDAASPAVEKASDTNETEAPSFVRVAPRLRKLAKDLQVDLTEVRGTGKAGKITEADIKNHAKGRSASTKGEQLTGIRKTIADRMRTSLQKTAQLTETAYADVTKLAKRRKQAEHKISWNTWIMYTTVKALQKHAYMNGTLEDEHWKEGESIHLGMATDAEDGLYVPVVTSAEEHTLDSLDEAIQALSRAVQDKTIEQTKLRGSTFTVTNLGGYGVHFFTPIINPPEVAILGLGKIDSYAAFENGEVVEKWRLPLSVTFDHQVIDGAPAAKFIQTLIHYLEHPDEL